MKKLLLIISVFLPILAGSSAQGGIFAQLAGFLRCENNLVPGISSTAIENLSQIEIGETIRYRTRRKGPLLTGRVESVNFTGVVIEGVGLIEHDHFLEIEILRNANANTTTSAALERRRQYISFLKQDFWTPLIPGITADVQQLRTLDRTHRETFLRSLGQEIVEAVQAKFGINNIGFHFNLNGGQGYQYVDRGGILTSRGDVGLQYGMGSLSGNVGSLNQRVYFFQSAKINLYDLLNEQNPKIVFGNSRMGHELSVFSLDDPYFTAAMQSGDISGGSDIFYDFSDAFDRKVGIPLSLYLAPPLEVFTSQVFKRFKGLGRLSRDEETLITMRYLQAVLLNQNIWRRP